MNDSLECATERGAALTAKLQAKTMLTDIGREQVFTC